MTNNRPKISVVVPVFKSEQYIQKVARCLFEQTLEEIEYIFVDDFSPDNSIRLLKQVLVDYPDRMNNVIIYKMPINSGQAAVRKKGIELATGSYIIHCDSDDWVDVELYQAMYDKALSDGCDMVVCDDEVIRGEETSIWEWKESDDLLPQILNGRGQLWDKLVKAEIVKDAAIVFPLCDMGEDLAMTSQYSLSAKKFGFVHGPKYHYVRHDESKLGDRSSCALITKQLEIKNNFDIVIDVLKSKGLRVKYSQNILHEQVFIKNMILDVMDEHRVSRIWKRIYPHLLLKVIISRAFSLREKANFCFASFGLYPLYARYKNMAKS